MIFVCLSVLFAWFICVIILYWFFSSKNFSYGIGTDVFDDTSIGFARTVAAFLVAYVHSFLTETGSVSYYHTPMSGMLMGVATMLRWLAFCCVPLFMLLTGFLCVHRTSFKDNIKRLIPMLGSFVIVCMLHLLFRRFYWNIPISPQYIMSIVFDMDLAWYLEMYIGLVLLQPFLNILWMKLDQKQRGTLICILLALTTLGSITENLLPTWWVTLYPLTYYFIGAWLREYPLTIRSSYLLSALIAALLLTALRSFSEAAGDVFLWEPLGGSINVYYSTPVAFSAVVFFLLTLKTCIQTQFLQQFFVKAGRHTLTTYLVLTAVTENPFWTVVRPYFPTYQKSFPVQFPLTIVLYLVTLVIAIMIDIIVQFCWKCRKYIFSPGNE